MSCANRPTEMALSVLWLRRLIDEPGRSLGLAALLLVTVFVVALAPLALAERSSLALRSELAAAPAVERNIVVRERAVGRGRALAELEDMRAAADRLRTALPADVGALIASHSSFVETPLWLVRSGSDLQTVLRLRIHDGALERIRLTSGRLPTDRTTIVADDRPNAQPGQYSVVYEAILPASAAAEMGLAEGDQLPLEAWFGDQTNIGVGLAAVLDIVGTYELSEPADDFWLTDATIGGWQLHMLGTDTFLETAALLAPAVYPALVGNTHGDGMSLAYEYRYFVAPDALSAQRLPQTIGALRRLEGAVPRTGMSEFAIDTRLTSGLLGVLEQHQATWRSAEAVLALVGLAVLIVAGGTLAVAVMVASASRRQTAAMLRVRGARGGQLLGSATVEATLLCLPAGLVGLLLALVIVPSVPVAPAVALAVALTALAAAIVVGTALRSAPAAEFADRRSIRTIGAPSVRRLVLEAAFVVGVLGAAWLLRERGIAAATGGGGGDPLVAVVLALVGIAGGIVAMRLYPIPARVVGVLMARRRDLLPVLAARRATRGGSSAAILLLMVATATVGTFASVALAYLERGAVLASWQQVGADFRISSPTLVLPQALDDNQLPGALAASRLALRSIDTSRGTAWLVVFDPATLVQVVRDTPAELAVPEAMLGPSDSQLPAIGGGLGLRAGDGLQATINQTDFELRLAGTRQTFPGVPAGSPFVAVAADQLRSSAEGSVPPAGMVYVRAPPAAGEPLLAHIAAIAPWLELDDRQALADTALGTPVLLALHALIGGGVLLTAGYAALAVGATLLLVRGAQAAEAAQLRALGLSSRARAWLTLLEYGPAALVGYVLGIGLGLGLFSFVLPALGLTEIIGAPLVLPLVVEPLHLGLLAALMVVILGLGWLLSLLAQRGVGAADLRRGIE